MANVTPGSILRQLNQVHGGMKKARQALRLVRVDPSETGARQAALSVGWLSLTETHRVLSEIPVEVATEDVMTKQLAVQRYATALLVRLRRLVRNEPATAEDDFGVDDEE